ncbi:MAG TPA: DVUA0089 family protein [Burkholderiaceae bacterium]
MKAIRTLLASAALVAAGSLAHAAPVAVTGSNHAFGDAFDVPASAFDTGADPDIDDAATVPHASVVDLAAGPLDYYRVTLAAAGTLTLDVDYGDGWDHAGLALDTKLAVWTSGGALLAVDDDDPRPWGFPGPSADAGSSSTLDPWLQLGGLAAGSYVIGVAYSGADAADGGWLPGGEIPPGGMYELNVSVGPSSAPVPEPAPALAWVAGALTLALARRRQGR